MSQGILSMLINQFKNAGISVVPQLQNNEIAIRITQSEVYEYITKGMTPEQKASIRVELHEGEMVIRVRLF